MSERAKSLNRRRFLKAGSGMLALAACHKDAADHAESTPGSDVVATSPASASEPSALGAPLKRYGERSPFEAASRSINPKDLPANGVSLTPIQDTYGIITPSALHFESHHAGVPAIDPAKHDVLVHGLTERNLVFTVDDIHRFPSVSRIYFIECSGNSGREHVGRPGDTAQASHGQMSCTEWTGVPLSVLLREAGLLASAKWIVAEGADACRHARSIPLEKALDDILVAYGQNGEAIRPEQGYPLRLVVPGWEGNVSVKWLSRIQVVDRPYMTHNDVTYTDLLPNGKARQFSFVMEAKSVITRPSGGQQLRGPGAYEITGLAWSGRGRVKRVEVSTDDGKTWRDASLQEPVLSKAFTRFSLPWRWLGAETTIQSRCTDETGYLQPTRDELVAVRGMSATDHYNGIKVWRVCQDGKITHA